MARYPGATWSPVPFKNRALMPKPVRINFHTAVSNAGTLTPYFSTVGNDSHFYVREDGGVIQMVDTKYRANADYRGNPDTIAVETWDGYGRDWKAEKDLPKWNDAQVAALVDLTLWILKTHPTIPLKLATTSKAGSTSHGLSWHRLGVPATGTQKLLGHSQTGGMLYSPSVGKGCPGTRRIAQMPEIYRLVVKASTKPSTGGGTSCGGGTSGSISVPARVKRWPNASIAVTGVFDYETKLAFQTLLAGIKKYNGYLDGNFGPLSVKAMQEWLRSLGFKDSRADGKWGKLTTRALQKFLRAKGLYKGLMDDDFGPMTIKALQTYLNAQAKHFK